MPITMVSTIQGIRNLLDGEQFNPKIAYSIEVMNRNVPHEDVLYLIEHMKQKTNISRFTLRNNQFLEAGDFDLLMSSLPSFHLKTLELNQQQLTLERMQSLCRALPHMKQLTHLTLRNHMLTPVLVRELCKTIEAGCNVKYLDLANNQITVGGAVYLPVCLYTDKTKLLHISLANNMLDENTAYVLVAAIGRRKYLGGMNLSGNPLVGKRTMKHLEEVLADYPQSFTLSLSDIDGSGEAFLSLLSTVTKIKIKRLVLTSDTFVNDRRFDLLLDAIEANPAFILLDVSYNVHITDVHMPKLYKLLQSHRTFMGVNLMDTGVSVEWRHKIAKLSYRKSSKEARSMVALCSVRKIPRLGVNSNLKPIPNELLRKMNVMLHG